MALRRVLGERAQDQLLDGLIDRLAAALRQPRHVLVEVRGQDLDDVAVERQRAGQHQVAEHAERVDVRGDARRPTGGALGREVVRAAVELVLVVAAGPAGEPEIEQPRDPPPPGAAWSPRSA